MGNAHARWPTTSVARGLRRQRLGPQGFGEVCLWADPDIHTAPSPARGMRREERRAAAALRKQGFKKSKRCKEKNSHPLQIKMRELRN